MNRCIQILNFVGVLVLVGLCALQWTNNRTLNLETNRLEQIRQEQAARLAEQEKTIKGQGADLDTFRAQLEHTHSALKAAERKNAVQEQKLQRFVQENETLKTSVAEWSAAVHARDERLREANDRINAFAARADAAVRKFNQLATDHNDVVRQLNEARTQSSAKTTQAPPP
jgi:5-bromo-4-chloroindolyl phosphate hydrolysis protein